jgi:hypothetical protein
MAFGSGRLLPLGHLGCEPSHLVRAALRVQDEDRGLGSRLFHPPSNRAHVAAVATLCKRRERPAKRSRRGVRVPIRRRGPLKAHPLAAWATAICAASRYGWRNGVLMTSTARRMRRVRHAIAVGSDGAFHAARPSGASVA